MNKNLYAFGIAGIVSFVALFSGWKIHESFEKKHTQQERNFNALRQSRLRLEGVVDYGTRFDSTFPLITDVPDMLGLYKVLNISEVAGISPDNLELVSIENVTINGKKLPLYEICIANANSGFEIIPHSASDAVNRAIQIDSRPDIKYGSLSLYKTANGLSMAYDTLCILGRV